jgi:hypothetical protein
MTEAFFILVPYCSARGLLPTACEARLIVHTYQNSIGGVLFHAFFMLYNNSVASRVLLAGMKLVC